MFLLIFTFQVLPVREIGKLMGKGQTTEEVEDDAGCDNDAQGKLSKYGDPDDQIVPAGSNNRDQLASRIGFNNKLAAFIHKEESLPAVHVAEMPYPPPDMA